ncbi:MAG: N-acetylmuramoyl-L-alanine amidase, partial [Clostridia bacterium]|nr:N-acetylmuramoyl-L-alanine amidase [Clostridia bacterium]
MKKIKLFTLKKHLLFKTSLVLCLIIAVVSSFVCVQISTSKPNLQKVIVIDAGHGGQDGGAVGKESGITESELNLKYALYLKTLCTQYGFKVVLTRANMGGLYSPLAQNKKKSEMQKRKEIVEKTKPNLVVSVHMNSFPSAECRGAQVFYDKQNESGKKLASMVQTSLNEQIDHAKKTEKVGDYYILNCVGTPSILVECGFLSNPEEEMLLQDEVYMHKFCYSVMCGILQY